MEKEFVIWGVPPMATEETVLYTKATTMREAEKVVRTLVVEHGVTKPRIQVIDFTRDITEDWRL